MNMARELRARAGVGFVTHEHITTHQAPLGLAEAAGCNLTPPHPSRTSMACAQCSTPKCTWSRAITFATLSPLRADHEAAMANGGPALVGTIQPYDVQTGAAMEGTQRSTASLGSGMQTQPNNDPPDLHVRLALACRPVRRRACAKRPGMGFFGNLPASCVWVA